MSEFRTNLGHNVFFHKYAQGEGDTWKDISRRVVDDVCGTMGGREHPLMSRDELGELERYIREFKFLPGGRYLYYAGRELHAWNNCFLLRAEEDTREEWAAVAWRSMRCLTIGGGIGCDYSRLRPKGRILRRTGGRASGPVPLMHAVDAIGRQVMQGGSRRSAIYASLNWQHEDVWDFLRCKDWHNMPVGKTGLTIKDMKEQDFMYPAPMEMTNISLNWDDDWLDLEDRAKQELFVANVRNAMHNGEPGFSFNFGDKSEETLRNACTEVTSEDDSDVCNLGSVNMGRINTLEEFIDVVRLASKFLVCGTIRADLPYDKVKTVREQNRRLGLGLMGIHEWLLKRNFIYGMNGTLRTWMAAYKNESEAAANEHCDRFYISRPIAYRAIAPTGTIGILAGTTTGIEPVYAVSYKRRYLVGGDTWRAEYVVDATAQSLIDEGISPDDIETAVELAQDPRRRIEFQADVQDYVDMGISSTLNLPSWDTDHNNDDLVPGMAQIISEYAPRLRGLTFYPDGARGGQPIVPCPYEEAVANKDVILEENDSCKGGVCGL